MANQPINVQSGQQPAQQPMHQPMHHPIPQSTGPARSGSKVPWIILAVVVLVVLGVLGFLFRDKLSGNGTATADKLSGYQAVFLTNGQVYFGKISNPSSDYVTLKDIYYLQVNQALQSAGTTAAQTAATADQQPQLSLVKLGNELHGPVDSMQINRTQILFFEDLKADGKVSQAIDAYKKNPNGAPVAPATNTPVTTPPVTPAK
ncbi:MAG: hypothetical protein JWO40_888 [Candidatus Doudnabacteria bacterium]|nr:hypothetical protein [Candidatus Doudnabacteria bacterium]